VDAAHYVFRLTIGDDSDVISGETTVTFKLTTHGDDRLHLIQNLHGDRSVFSENWPNRARQWLPMIDHPYDKAMGEFIVTAPAHYQVVANGLLIEALDLPDGQRRTHWKQSVPISSWLFTPRDVAVCRLSRRAGERRAAPDVGVPSKPRKGLRAF